MCIRDRYKTYGITALEELSPRIGDPEVHLDDAANEDQVAAMEEALEAYPDSALTYDQDTELWIVGAEEDIERMLGDRESFVEALLNDEDPGI